MRLCSGVTPDLLSGLPMTGFVFHTNRASAVFKAALTPMGGRPFADTDSHIDLLYFDEYGGKRPPCEVSVALRLMHRQRTIPLDNKSTMAATLIAAGINNPRVFFHPDDVPIDADSLWFIKDPMLAAGKGIHVVPREQIAAWFKPGCIIQEAVQDLLLLHNKKFTLRAYVLVHRGRLWLFPAAIAVVHAAEYDPQSLHSSVQFDHAGYMKADSLIKMQPFAEQPEHPAVMQHLATTMSATFAAFSNLLKFEKQDRYCLFGIDALVKSDLTTVLIEINDRPNLVHSRSVSEAVNVPMVRAMLCALDPARADLLPPTAPRFELIAAL